MARLREHLAGEGEISAARGGPHPPRAIEVIVCVKLVVSTVVTSEAIIRTSCVDLVAGPARHGVVAGELLLPEEELPEDALLLGDRVFIGDVWGAKLSPQGTRQGEKGKQIACSLHVSS